MANDKLGETIDVGDNYFVAGTVRRVDGDNVVVVTGLNGEHAFRLKNNEVVRLDSMAAIAYVDGQISFALALAVATFQPLNSLLTYIATNGVDSNMIVDGSIATVDLGDNVVSNAKLRDSAALSVVGRSANSSGDPADIAATAASGAVLREAGNTIGWGTVATAGISNNAITNAKLAQMAAATIKGRASGAGTGDPTDLSAAQVAAILSGQFAPASHEHAGEECNLESSGWSGALAGSGVRDLQQLADWLDANLTI